MADYQAPPEDTQAQLAKSGGGTTTLGYAYDGAGNRTSAQVDSNPAVTTTYDTAGYPISSSDGTAYAFDARGDLTSMTGGPRIWTFTYDAWSRTTKAEGPLSKSSCLVPEAAIGT